MTTCSTKENILKTSTKNDKMLLSRIFCSLHNVSSLTIAKDKINVQICKAEFHEFFSENCNDNQTHTEMEWMELRNQ